jgi:hypothetical protein
MKTQHMITLLFLLMLARESEPLRAEAYIRHEGGTMILGNRHLERQFTPGPGAWTTRFVNKESGRVVTARSREFSLRLICAGFGPAFGKAQNGENPATISAADMVYLGSREEELGSGERRLTLLFRLQASQMDLHVKVVYGLLPDDPFMRKWVDVCDSAGGIHFLDRVEVEDLAFEKSAFSRGEFGQPVFCGDFFLGLEYPGVENTLEASRVRIGQVVGKKISAGGFRSDRGIWGVAQSPSALRRTFLDYVETIKVRGTRPYLLYNSWYDMRHPSRTDSAASFMNEANALGRLASLRKELTERRGITLDAFVLDDGWDNTSSIWCIDSTTFPRGFTPVQEALRGSHTGLGLWASPFCGYDARALRVDWGTAHGYERTGEFLCFAGDKYREEFKRKMVGLTRDYGIAYFKWDGFLLACNETDHGHLPGIYSRDALISAFREAMSAVREVNPNIFINITVGTWLSPWWLMYADCVWMQGEDYGYAEQVPSVSPRDKAITYRDAVLWDDLRKQDLLFPVSGMMTHGIIRGSFNLLGGKDEPLDSFTNEIVMYMARGVMMWELYLSPDVLKEREWDAIAGTAAWAKEHKDILARTTMILGDPLKREPYGYAHLRGDSGIILLRNPFAEERTVSLSLFKEPGGLDRSKEYAFRVVYPYHMILPKSVRSAEPTEVSLGAYEVLVAEVVPSGGVSAAIPRGTRYDIDSTGIHLFERRAGAGDLKVLDKGVVGKGEGRRGHELTVIVPDQWVHAKISVLVEPDSALPGNESPVVSFMMDGVKAQTSVDQEGGKWFWTSADLKQGRNRCSYSLTMVHRMKGKVSVWVTGEEILTGRDIGNAAMPSDRCSLPKPYPPSVKRISKKIAGEML